MGKFIVQINSFTKIIGKESKRAFEIEKKLFLLFFVEIKYNKKKLNLHVMLLCNLMLLRCGRTIKKIKLKSQLVHLNHLRMKMKTKFDLELSKLQVTIFFKIKKK